MVTPTDRTLMGSRVHDVKQNVDDSIEEWVSSNPFPLQLTEKTMYNQKKYYRNDTLFVCNTIKCFLTSLTVSYALTGIILLISTVCIRIFYVKTPTARIRLTDTLYTHLANIHSTHV